MVFHKFEKRVVAFLMGDKKGSDLEAAIVKNDSALIALSFIRAFVFLSFIWMFSNAVITSYTFLNNRISIDQAVLLNDKVLQVERKIESLEKEYTQLIEARDNVIATKDKEILALSDRAIDKELLPFYNLTMRKKNPLRKELIYSIIGNTRMNGFTSPEDATKLMIAIYYVESHFNETAKNPSGARGLGQILPSTGRDIHKRILKRNTPFHTSDLFKPLINIEYSVAYVSERLNAFNGDPYKLLKSYCGASTKRRADKYINKLNVFLEANFGENIYDLNLDKS